MKINISNWDNIDAIVEAFESASPCYWDEDRYLVMNNETLSEISYRILDQYDLVHTDTKMNKYHGYRIVIDNELDSEIIDIR